MISISAHLLFIHLPTNRLFKINIKSFLLDLIFLSIYLTIYNIFHNDNGKPINKRIFRIKKE